MQRADLRLHPPYQADPPIGPADLAAFHAEATKPRLGRMLSGPRKAVLEGIDNAMFNETAAFLSELSNTTTMFSLLSGWSRPTKVAHVSVIGDGFG
jgi:hypothetical protein